MQPQQRNVYQSGLPLFVLRTVGIIQGDSLCNLLKKLMFPPSVFRDHIYETVSAGGGCV